VKHEGRVLAAWIVGGQLLTLPCLALGTMMGAIAIRPETDPATRVLVYALPLLVEGMVAFAVALTLRARLARGLSYSPLVVALASCGGMVLALLVASAALMAWQRLVPGFDSDVFGIAAACVTGVLLIMASGMGVLLATRGEQVAP
jgi:acid phosphatase family membrane protein YuiD